MKREKFGINLVIKKLIILLILVLIPSCSTFKYRVMITGSAESEDPTGEDYRSNLELHEIYGIILEFDKDSVKLNVSGSSIYRTNF